MVKRLYCFLFFSVFIFSVFSDTVYFKRNIQGWEIQKMSVSDSQTVNVLTFTNASFNNEYGQTPIYYEKFQLSSPNNFRININNLVFQACNAEESQLLSNLNFSNDSVIINSSSIQEQKVPYAAISFIPIRKNKASGQYEKLIAFEVELDESDNLLNGQKGSDGQKGSGRTYAQHSVLASGNWYKISVANTGIYKLTYDDLTNLGINVSSIDPRNIRIFGNGPGMLPETNTGFKYDDLQENAIQVVGESDGKFDAGDYILFYGQSPTTWAYGSDNEFHHTTNSYSDVTCYFITTDLGAGKRIGNLPSTTLPNNVSAAQFIDYTYHESDLVNLIQSGRQWYGEAFDVLTSYNFNVSFPNLDVNSSVYLKADVVARSGIASQFTVTANGANMAINVPNLDLSNYDGDYAEESNGIMNFSTSTPSIDINISYNEPTQTSLGWLNYFEINATRNLAFYGNQMPFRNVQTVAPGNVTEFTLSNANASVNIWDVTAPLNIQQVGTTLNNTNLVFRLPTDSLHEFIAFNGSSFFSPSLIGAVNNQDLHGIEQCDFVIVSHPDFVSAANQLAQFHRNNDAFNTIVVTPDQIYNEFSSGSQDVSAIRDFLKMLYDRASTADQMPKYLLLFGDGSYDYKSTANNKNYVPTYESPNSLQPEDSYLTDDYFGLLDDGEGSGANGTLDIGIGRLPVQTASQATDMVNKVLRYTSKSDLTQNGTSANSFTSSISNLGDWKNVICFVADDGDSDMHLDQADQLATYVDTIQKQFNIDKIYFDAYQQLTTSAGTRFPDAETAINNMVGKGTLIMNYTGHGGPLGWALERVLTIPDINSWNNTNNLPVFFTASCAFSPFDNPASVSAGELVLLNPAGGGIALFTTTRLAFSSSNYSLNKSFYDYAFQKQNNKCLKMGDIMRKAKVANIGSGDNIKNFVLLGDPAIQLAYPEYNVVTTAINGDSINKKSDTLKAFSKVTVSGYIQDFNGSVKTNFNGILYPTVYDKYSIVSTLGNNPASPVANFSIQNNILYKGKINIKNGEFTFSFIVPKDIAYNFGCGKISYYAASDSADATGFYNKVTIGGSLENISINNTDGPVVRLFMNDTTFKSGGITDQSPFLLAYVSDPDGINTVGNGIGHDIVAVLDGNTSESIILNDYFVADLNSYTSGIIEYPFSNLSEGTHTLSLTVWDNYNNSTTVEIEFVVVSSNQLKLNNVINYPNPFSTQTKFSFEHNCSCNTLNVEIQIYNMTGQTVKTINQTVFNEGYDATVSWDGTSDSGAKLSGGIYIYKLQINDSAGAFAIKSGKLVIFN